MGGGSDVSTTLDVTENRVTRFVILSAVEESFCGFIVSNDKKDNPPETRVPRGEPRILRTRLRRVRAGRTEPVHIEWCNGATEPPYFLAAVRLLVTNRKDNPPETRVPRGLPI